jgi:hypothetical protein
MITPRTSRTTTDTGSDTSVTFNITRPSFWDDALCREPSVVAEVGTNLVDAERNKEQTTRAMQACGRCLVMFECRQYALDDKTLLGIWGGTTTTARVAMRSARRGDRAVGDHPGVDPRSVAGFRTPSANAMLSPCDLGTSHGDGV